MTLGHFWPLVAERAKKLVFECSKSVENQFFGFFSLLRPKMTLTQKKASISTLHFSKGIWNLGVHSHYSHLWGTAVRLG